MKKKTSWKFTDESSVTFQLSVSGPGEFGIRPYSILNMHYLKADNAKKNKRMYNIPVLSGSASVGQLFDAKTGQLLHDRFLWKNPIAVNEAIITSTSTETTIENSIKDRMSLLDFSASIKGTVMGLVDVS